MDLKKMCNKLCDRIVWSSYSFIVFSSFFSLSKSNRTLNSSMSACGECWLIVPNNHVNTKTICSCDLNHIQTPVFNVSLYFLFVGLFGCSDVSEVFHFDIYSIFSLKIVKQLNIFRLNHSSFFHFC